jgi:hypothetical protein
MIRLTGNLLWLVACRTHEGGRLRRARDVAQEVWPPPLCSALLPTHDRAKERLAAEARLKLVLDECDRPSSNSLTGDRRAGHGQASESRRPVIEPERYQTVIRSRLA